MGSDKLRVTFRADEDVATFIESLPDGVKSVEINKIIRDHLEKKKTLEDRVKVLEKKVKALEKSP